MAGDDAAAIDRLNAYLDRLADGLTASPTPPEPDPIFAEAVRRLQAHDEAPNADPAFARRLLEDLMHAPASPRPFSTWPGLTTGPNGRMPPQSPPTPTLRAGTARRQWSPRGPLAPAALLVLTLVGGLLAVGALRPGADDRSMGGSIPAPMATPEGAAELLLEVALTQDTLPTQAVGPGLDFNFWRARIDPGGRVTVSADYGRCCPGPEIEYVLAGTLVLRVDGPASVVRTGAERGAREAIPPGAEVVLTAGDAAIIPFDRPRELINPGPEPLELLGGGLFAAYMPAPASGYHVLIFDEHYPVPPPPAGPVTATLRRITLAPEGVVSPPAAGDLRAILTEPSQGTVAKASDGSVRNSGRIPAVVYVLTLHPVGQGAGTPVAAAPAIETLVDVALTADDTLPEPFDLQVWFGSVAPGARVEVSSDYFQDAPATNVEYVLEGRLAVRVDGPLRVVRAGGATEAVPPATEVVLGPGDAAVFPLATAFELVNPTQSLVRLVGFGVLSAIWTPVAPGYGTGRYAYREHAALPTGPLRLSLLRTTLEPDALLPAPATGELRVTLVEEDEASGLRDAADGALRNPNPEAVVVYVLVLRSADAGAASPAADAG